MSRTFTPSICARSALCVRPTNAPPNSNRIVYALSVNVKRGSLVFFAVLSTDVDAVERGLHTERHDERPAATRLKLRESEGAGVPALHAGTRDHQFGLPVA